MTPPSGCLKVDWLKKSNFGGAMVWTLDMDDYMGTFCNQGKYPLINVLKKGLNLEQACKTFNTSIIIDQW